MIRKIIKIGNSEGIIIPASTMRARKLRAGERVEVYIGKQGSKIDQLELLSELQRFSKTYGRALKNLAKK